MSKDPTVSTVFRPGDLVRVLDPRPILRVGYEADAWELAEEASKDPRVLEFIKEMGLDDRGGIDICHAIGKSKMARSKVDGTPRKVIYKERDGSLLGKVYRVAGKRNAWVGSYCSAYYGSSPEEWEGAALGSAEMVIVLHLVETEAMIYGPATSKRRKICLGGHSINLPLYDELPRDSLEVLSTQVEKVEDD